MDLLTRINEAHGLWELAVVRVSAFVEIALLFRKDGLAPTKFYNLVWVAAREEREAYDNWKRVSRECGA